LFEQSLAKAFQITSRKGDGAMGGGFAYSLDNKRYHTFDYYLKNRFGGKVGKVALDGGFTCPNIDGRVGTGGCIYCSPRGSGDFAADPAQSITRQIARQRERLREKWPDAGCIAYFQAHSGTYAPVEALRDKYEEALACPDVVGLFIATRADLLAPEVVTLLAELHRRTCLVVELGLQTIHDDTAARINRCHTYAQFLEGYRRLEHAGIAVCVHIINGLPGESREMMLETACVVGALRPHSVKLHMLHILKNTAIAPMFEAGLVPLPEMDAYIQLVCDQLELLPSEIVIQRLTGDAPAGDLIAPLWITHKRRVLNGIDKELARRNSRQGLRLE